MIELASRADCGDRENEWVCDIITAYMPNEKNAEELLAETRSPQDACEYVIRREKGVEHSKAMKTNPFGASVTTIATIKQETMGYFQPSEKGGNTNVYQKNQSGRGSLRGRHILPRGSYNSRGQQNQQMGRNKCLYESDGHFGLNHFQSCPAEIKICTKCATPRHFENIATHKC